VSEMTITKRVEERRRLSKLSLDELADDYANWEGGESHTTNRIYEAEFLRRQTGAIVDSAEYAKKNTLYMLWAVWATVAAAIAAAVSAYGSLVSK